MKITDEQVKQMRESGGYFMFMFSVPFEYGDEDKLLSTMVEQYYCFAKKEMYGEDWKVTLPQYGVVHENIVEEEVDKLFGGKKKVKSVKSVSYYLYFSKELTEEEKLFYRAFKFGWFSSYRFNRRKF